MTTTPFDQDTQATTAEYVQVEPIQPPPPSTLTVSSTAASVAWLSSPQPDRATWDDGVTIWDDGSPKKVAIVGFASSSRDQAPFNDPAWSIWTMNHAPLSWIPKWDVLFELHTMDHLRRIAAHSTDPTAYLDWLGKQPGVGDPQHKPIYMQEHNAAVPASVPFPREALNAWFAERGGNAEGFFAKDYYTSTVSFMLALAIMQGADEIGIYGVDLLNDEEYVYQRAGCEYLVGFARGLGIKVFVPEQSALCKANYTYGFNEPTEAGKFTPLVDYIEDKAKLSDKAVERARQDTHTFNGAMQMADLVLGWLQGKDNSGKDVTTLVTEKRAELQRRFEASRDATLTMNGQAEAFRTSVVWTKHYARGGALNS